MRSLCVFFLVFWPLVEETVAHCPRFKKLEAAESSHAFTDGSDAEQDYSNNLDCSWLIATKEKNETTDTRVVLQFDRFHLENASKRTGECYDYVELFDGENDSAPSLGRFCGSEDEQLKELLSSGNVFFLRFHSDKAYGGRGFRVSYRSKIKVIPLREHMAVLQARLDALEARLKGLFETQCPANCSGNGDCLLKLNSSTQTWEPVCICSEGYLPPSCEPRASGGTGNDGDLIVDSTVVVNKYWQFSGLSGNQFGRQLTTSSIVAGDEVLLVQMQGSGAGNYEFQQVVSVSGQSVNFKTLLNYTYVSSGNSRAQIVLVPKYGTLTIQSTGLIQAGAYDGSIGGVIVFRAVNLRIESGGKIDASGKGFRGGPRKEGRRWVGVTGESYTSSGFAAESGNANNGGGGGSSYCDCGESAGSGSYGTVGSNPTGSSCSGQHGLNGNTYGDPALIEMYLGSGGGGGCRVDSCDYSDGANGGGMVYIEASTAIVNGYIWAKGGAASGGSSGSCDDTIGGAGSGGSIYLRAGALLSSNPGSRFSVQGGGRTRISQTGIYGSSGGNGRIRVDYSTIDGQEYGSPEAKAQEKKYGGYAGVGYWGTP
ncbi:PE-PGRS family protein PE_PGRS5-like [Oscarella lobularis]|uniref:PE-PGRS family protein PE_PGRS5-like n=1 Tax=Oscarella lobularis TaxID=121494 RepID=UPI0033133407